MLLLIITKHFFNSPIGFWRENYDRVATKLPRQNSKTFPWPYHKIPWSLIFSKNSMSFPENPEKFKIPENPWLFHDRGNPVWVWADFGQIDLHSGGGHLVLPSSVKISGIWGLRAHFPTIWDESPLKIDLPLQIWPNKIIQNILKGVMCS